jgi:hypothetical protein
MKAELLERKQADLNKGKTTNSYTPKPVKQRRRKGPFGKMMIVFLIILAIWILAFVVTAIQDSKTPNRGYYDYKGTPYYYAAGAWYTPDDYGEWERTYDAPDTLTENYKDYYEAKDYSDLDADYADDIEEYPTEEYSNDYDNDDDSWNDSNWDDDDWDYDWDDYDSYDSDWDSDW